MHRGRGWALVAAVVLATVTAGLMSWGALGTSPAGAETESEPSGPRVTNAVQVTSNPDPTRAHSSPQMARNPTNGELAIVETEVRNDRGCNIHLSGDNGQTWSAGGDPMMEPWTQCSGNPINGPYATLEFDQDGVLYVAFYANDPEYLDAADMPLHVFLARSEDGGRTFETTFVHESPEPVEENEGLHNNDRPMVAVDQNDPSNVYVGWMQRGAEDEVSARAMMAASTDGGETFNEPVQVSDERGAYQPRPTVAPDGTVHVIFPIGLDSAGEDENPFEMPRTVLHRRSTDQGETWSDFTEVDEGNAGFDGGRKYVLQAHHETGDLYAAWYANEEPLFDPTEEDVDIFLRISRDGGETWEDRIVLNDDDVEELDRVNQYNPGVSIAPNGRIDVAWYDFRNSPYPERNTEEFEAPFNHDGFQDVYYTYSTDDGQSWAPNVRITDRIINREIGVWSNNVHSHLNVGIASSNEGAFFAWQDTRNGNYENESEDIYFASAWHGDAVAPAAAMSSGAADWSPWLLLGAGVLAGMGLAMVVALALMRRTRPSS